MLKLAIRLPTEKQLDPDTVFSHSFQTNYTLTETDGHRKTKNQLLNKTSYLNDQ